MEGYIFTPFTSTIKNAPFLRELVNVSCRSTPVYNSRLNMLKSDLEGYIRRGYNVTVVCSTDERMEGVGREDFLSREKLTGTGPSESGRYNRRNGIPSTVKSAISGKAISSAVITGAGRRKRRTADSR